MPQQNKLVAGSDDDFALGGVVHGGRGDLHDGFLGLEWPPLGHAICPDKGQVVLLGDDDELVYAVAV